MTYGGTLLKTTRHDDRASGSRALIRIRDAARLVLQSQNDGWPDAHREEARRELNRHYDVFVQQYGLINKTTFSESQAGTVIQRMPNLVKFIEDPDAMLVMALEDCDPTSGTAVKAAIMTRDVVGRAPPVTAVRTAEEGLLVSLDQKGEVDLAYIASLYGADEPRIIEELGDLIYQDPVTRRWQTADDYLSGNVREKLAVAEAAGPEYARNAEALRAVQPEDVLPGEIDANLGAPWVPEGDIQAFAAELFGVPPSSISVGHLKKDALWSVEAGYDAASERAGHDRLRHGEGQRDHAPRAGPEPEDPGHLRRREPRRPRGAGREPGGDARRPREAETHQGGVPVVGLRRPRADRAARPGLQRHLQQPAAPGLRRVAPRVPRDEPDDHAPPAPEGRHLAGDVGREHAPGPRRRGREDLHDGRHRHEAEGRPGSRGSRSTSSRTTCSSSSPGSSSSSTRTRSSSWRRRRTSPASGGRCSRRRSRAPSGTASSSRTARSSESGCRGTTRRGSSGSRSPSTTSSSWTASRTSNRAHRNIIKTIEKQKARREERLKDLLAEDKKDDGLVFDELGVDYLFIDEAHYFKNLETPTKMERVAGIQTGGSERAFDLYMKVRYLGELHEGHGVTFATGTPISNTMVEMYTMQRFLDPKGLRDRGIEHFDGWAATFGEVVDTMEIAPDGSSP